MERTNTCFLIVLFLLSISFSISLPQSLYAQEAKKTEKTQVKKPRRSFAAGYIVANHGDTTYGYIRNQDEFRSQRQVKFMDNYGIRAKYTPDRIKAYGTEDSDYEVLPTPINFSGLFSEPNIFLLRNIQGPTSLYRFFTRRSVFTLKRGPAYIDLIKKPKGDLFEVSYNFKWVRIADAFKDFPELADAIRNELFKPEDTPKIIERYNQWYEDKQKGSK